jgi:TusA-related sulfurtransferase
VSPTDGDSAEPEPGCPAPDHVFDGGDLDCGSGLVLLIRENMLRLAEGGILELRSREATVGSDLPPWCRMTGHEFLGAFPGDGTTRYFVRRSANAAAEPASLEADKRRSQEYEWRARVRTTGGLRETAYCRNFSFGVGQSASFEERDEHPSAVEYALGALGADICACLALASGEAGVVLDDVEITVRGRLRSVLAHLGVEAGDPSFGRIEARCFITTTEDEERIRPVWEAALGRSPLVCTLRKSVDMALTFVLV